jgi:hypothetical protein
VDVGALLPASATALNTDTCDARDATRVVPGGQHAPTAARMPTVVPLTRNKDSCACVAAAARSCAALITPSGSDKLSNPAGRIENWRRRSAEVAPCATHFGYRRYSVQVSLTPHNDDLRPTRGGEQAQGSQVVAHQAARSGRHRDQVGGAGPGGPTVRACPASHGTRTRMAAISRRQSHGASTQQRGSERPMRCT